MMMIKIIVLSGSSWHYFAKRDGRCLLRIIGRVQLKCDGTRWHTGGEVKGNWQMQWVASTLHTTSEHGVSNITTADVHTSAASSRLNWRHTGRFKWTRSVSHERRNLVSVSVPSHFNWPLSLVFRFCPEPNLTVLQSSYSQEMAQYVNRRWLFQVRKATENGADFQTNYVVGQ